jgi:hypothetical protein
MRPKQLYVVLKGKKTGIFNSWSGKNGVEIQITGFSGAKYRGRFYKLDDAIHYYKKYNNDEPKINFKIEQNNKVAEPDGKDYITYVLIDPRDKKPFYVGQTSNFEKRKKVYLKKKKNPFRKVDKYIADLYNNRLEPEFYIAEHCTNLDDSIQSELKWVRYCLDKGYNLMNRWKEHRKIKVK